MDEPVIADTLYLSSDDLAARRDRNVPLYSTEVMPGGAPAPFPFTLHGNAVVAQALDVLRRTLDEETARGRRGSRSGARRAASGTSCADLRGKSVFAAATDLAGHAQLRGRRRRLGALASAVRSRRTSRLHLPAHRQERDDAAVASSRGSAPGCSVRTRRNVLQWLRRAPLDGGYAAEIVTPEGQAKYNGGDASLSGLIAWTVWYAVHALGERP